MPKATQLDGIVTADAGFLWNQTAPQLSCL
jgi:hypothetical protein